jgi:hypothetical protein
MGRHRSKQLKNKKSINLQEQWQSNRLAFTMKKPLQNIDPKLPICFAK